MQAHILRDWIISAYPSKKWKEKVKDMTDEQVIALYLSLVRRGKIKGA